MEAVCLFCVCTNGVTCMILNCLSRESVLMDSLWSEMAPHVLQIFVEAAQGQSPGLVGRSKHFFSLKLSDTDKRLVQACVC